MAASRQFLLHVINNSRAAHHEIMSKKRTVASKKKQRRRQKKKKRLSRKQKPTVKSSYILTDVCRNTDRTATPQYEVPLDIESDSFGSPGSPPSTPSDMEIMSHPSPPHREEYNIIAEVNHLQQKCKSYKALLVKRENSEHNLRKKLKDQQSQMEDIISEAKREVGSIRTFWRDQIFREQTRAGVIVKRAICQK